MSNKTVLGAAGSGWPAKTGTSPARQRAPKMATRTRAQRNMRRHAGPDSESIRLPDGTPEGSERLAGDKPQATPGFGTRRGRRPRTGRSTPGSCDPVGVGDRETTRNPGSRRPGANGSASFQDDGQAAECRRVGRAVRAPPSALWWGSQGSTHPSFSTFSTCFPRHRTYFQSGVMSEPPSVILTGVPPWAGIMYNSQGPRSDAPWQ